MAEFDDVIGFDDGAGFDEGEDGSVGTGPAQGIVGLFPASRPAYNLLDAPGVLFDPATTRWINGASSEPDACNVPLDVDDAGEGDWPYWWDCGSGSTAEDTLGAVSGFTSGQGYKRVATSPELVEGDPVVLWGGYTCSTLSLRNQSEDEVRARVLRKLQAVIPVAVERELWTAQVANAAGFSNPALTDVATLTPINGSAPLGFVTALAELEQALADNGNISGRRIIHAQPRVVTAWRSQYLVEPDPTGRYLVTGVGTIVVPGNGYPGSGSNLAAGNYSHSWAYGTGQVRVLLGQPGPVDLISGAVMNRDLNDVIVRSEVEALVLFDPCLHVGVYVNLCDLYCGAGS